MKHASILLLILGIPLVIWGAVDTYHFASTGTALLKVYAQNEVIERLVHYSLINGLIKTTLGLLAIGISIFLWRKRNS